jgi:hypothetical protein
MKLSGTDIAPPIEGWCGARQTMAIHDWGLRRVANALLVEDEPAPGRAESVSIVPMTDVIIVVIALIATAFAITLAVVVIEM